MCHAGADGDKILVVQVARTYGALEDTEDDMNNKNVLKFAKALHKANRAATRSSPRTMTAPIQEDAPVERSRKRKQPSSK